MNWLVETILLVNLISLFAMQKKKNSNRRFIGIGKQLNKEMPMHNII